MSIRQEGVLTYYALLRRDFQDYSVEEIEEYVRRSKFAEMVRAKRIAIAYKDGASAPWRTHLQNHGKAAFCRGGLAPELSVSTLGGHYKDKEPA